MSRFKVLFVLPSFSIVRPPGGFNIVYCLSAHLNRIGISTGIVVPYNLRKRIAESLNFPELRNYPSLFHKLYGEFYSFSTKLGAMRDLLFSVLRKLFGSGYDYSIIKSIPIISVSDPLEFQDEVDIIIATAWETAYFVNDFLQNHNSLGMYLIQNSEDEAVYSGNASGLASKTYAFNLKKIVINNSLRERFRNDDPFLLHVGFDNQKYYLTKSIEHRQKFTVLFPLRTNISKGAIYAINAAKILRQRYTQLRIIAYGDYPRKNVPKWIEYHRLSSDEEVAMLYNESSIFVLPSLVEGMPVPPLEAMASGCAVVCTDNAGVREYLENEVNGLIIPPGDAEAMASAVGRLMSDSNLRIRIAMEGLITSRSFTYGEMYEAFTKIISQEISTISKAQIENLD